jgi:hypothetical protein
LNSWQVNRVAIATFVFDRLINSAEEENNIGLTS